MGNLPEPLQDALNEDSIISYTYDELKERSQKARQKGKEHLDKKDCDLAEEWLLIASEWQDLQILKNKVDMIRGRKQ